ncbi:hypothetical protein MG293_011791 [Ovis ammon polii]|uniref:Uncharacterized protein n=2 Tax=Ovis TaxID=9935 RepID=A0A836CWM8_SHEEP|nr:hypothetical protein JEQ12_004513 [Ovis aries]KAI4538388.1 hypothetical protein MG293_011791 [Ovis ammon polii]
MATGGGAEEERKRGRPQLLGPARPSTRAEEAEGGREKMGWAQVVKNLAEKKGEFRMADKELPGVQYDEVWSGTRGS